MTALASVLSVLDGMSSNIKMYTLLSALVFPVLNAIAVFVCLRNSGARRRLLCFFLGLPLYSLPTLFLLSEPGQTAETLYPGLGGAIPDVIGFLAAMALGIAYLGITALICSDRVMKTSGQIFILACTLVFFCCETALTYFSVIALTGTNTPATLGGVFVNVPSAVRNITVSLAGLAPVLIYVICFFCGFLFNKSKKSLINEDIAKLHRIKAETRRIEKEGVCAVCIYSDACPGTRGNINCSKHGNMPRDGRCRSFEYDPLKRVPEPKEKLPEVKENNDEKM